MFVRSLLFIPGDSERKLRKGIETKADALILDLEDAVSAARADVARRTVREFLDAHPRSARRMQIWVRTKPIQADVVLKDIAAIAGGAPDAILLPKVRNGADVALLDHYLSVMEIREEIEPGSIRIAPTLTEAPESMLNAQTFPGCSARLAGFSWGPIDLAAALQASTNRLPDGSFDTIYAYGRGLCVLVARAACVEPIDTICANYRDSTTLTEECNSARRSGFTGKLAIHPDQVDIINAAFTPSEQEIVRANRILGAFEGQEAGTIGLDGEMLDMPHLVQARTVLARARLYGVA
jgi:citrate lyase subunit beta/citryl-CoA lyase